MSTPRLIVLLSAALFLCSPRAGLAQTNGSIAGVVKDATGALLPGVTVEASSPVLIEKVRVGQTDQQGQYKIVDLRPGVYVVTFTLAGFSASKREGVELTTGFTATVNADLKIGAVEETITVTGATPIVDIHNVVAHNVFESKVLQSLPTPNTNYASLAALIPGATLGSATHQNVGGNQAEQATMGLHGMLTDQRLLMDGMRYGSMEGTGTTRTWAINSALVQETTVETSGSAEVETGGIQFNLVPKDGGNVFKTNLFANYADHRMDVENLTDKLRARGLAASARLKQMYDVNGALGGPLVKDRLWFFTAHRGWAAGRYIPGNYWNLTQHTLFYTPDLSRQAYTDSHYWDSSFRLNWQVAQKHKINLSYSVQNDCQCFWGLDGNFAPEAVHESRYNPAYLPQVTWSYPASNRLLFESGATLMKVNFGSNPVHFNGKEVVTVDDISVLELSTGFRYGSRGNGLNCCGAYSNNGSSNVNGRASMSYVTGSHALKTGLFWQYGFKDQIHQINQAVSYTFLNQRPSSVTLWASPLTESERMIDVGVYAQDQWTIRRLTLNLGARFDHLNAWVPEQHLTGGRWVPERNFAAVHDVPDWNDISPRLGVAYDLRGDGKTAVKASLGRYVSGETMSIATANNPVNTSVNSATRTWVDANGDFVPQEEELGRLSDASFGQQKILTRYSDDVLHGFGKRGYNWQSSASVQRQLWPGTALTVGYFRTWWKNFTSVDNLALAPADYSQFCVTAPVDARLPGGGGNQICGLYDVSPVKFGQVNNLIVPTETFGKQTMVFNGVDVNLNIRFTGGALLSGGLATGKTVTDNCVVVDSPQLRFCDISPPLSAGTQLKLFGVYPLPWNLQTSVTFQDLPGIPQTASFVATNAQVAPSLGRNLAAGAAGTVTMELIAPNSQFEDRIRQLDVRLTRVFRIGGARAQGMFDIYNVLNASPVLAVNTRYGPSWLRVQDIMAGRLFKVGAQLDF